MASLDLFVTTDCPCFLINLTDSHVSVCGALITDKPTVSWLTPLYPTNNKDTTYLCRLFKSLKLGVSALEKYYTSIPADSRRLSTPVPYITQMEGNSWTYNYVIKLKSNKIMYNATLDSDKSPLIVKFVQSYCVSAHSCMAIAGYAPRVYGTTRISNGWSVVVMEELSSEWKDLITLKKKKKQVLYKENLRAAVAFLHSNGFVHGDLRGNNVVSNSTGEVKATTIVTLFLYFRF
jgi:hypothetical protein